MFFNVPPWNGVSISNVLKLSNRETFLSELPLFDTLYARNLADTLEQKQLLNSQMFHIFCVTNLQPCTTQKAVASVKAFDITDFDYFLPSIESFDY